MSLVVGARLGVYEVLGTLGAGGMGDVYRARDTRLQRDVALKILPDSVASDPDRLDRFEREARVLASLNHPNIAQIYGVEESGDVRALAMELVVGDDLSTVIARGALPLADAVPIARQIVEALEAAHEAGIVHRDLKPANVKVRPDGVVKVLDFGLAKGTDRGNDQASSRASDDSPTMASPAMTQAGIILGTVAYMSPEQARGKTVDRRTDIWSFGVVLYEMLSGTQLFSGDTVSDVLAAVLTREPNWGVLPAETRGVVVRLVQRCLERDPRKRLRDIGEAVLVLADPAAAETVAVARTEGRVAWRERVAWGAATLAAAIAVWTVVRAPSTIRGVSTGVLHLSLPWDPSEIAPLGAAVSPDGSTVAFVGRPPGAASASVFVRALRDATARPLPGTEDVDRDITPVFSPDGRSVAYTTDYHMLKSIRIDGGPATTLAAGDMRFVLTAWADNGKILLVGFDPDHPGVIYELPEGGGAPTAVKGRPEQASAWLTDPRPVPGGKSLIFGIASRDHPAVAAQSLETGERRILARDALLARIVGPRLVWVEAGRVVSAPFDTTALTLSGPPVPIATDGLAFDKAPDTLEISDTGTLFFRPHLEERPVALAWLDRTGTKARVAGGEGAQMRGPHLSPDGTRVAFSDPTGENDVWTMDLGRGALSRVSFGPGEDESPIWSPDGAWIAWASSRTGQGRGLYRRRSDGSGAEEKLWADPRHFHADSWTRDGRSVVLTVDDPKTGWDVYLVTLGATSVATPLLAGRFSESNARLSTDGRWIAYVSDESGRREVYAQSFPGLGRKVQISVGGGLEPMWNPRGGEIVYRSPTSRNFVSVSVAAGEALVPSPAHILVSDVHTVRGMIDHTSYDIGRDGRLLVVEEPPSDAGSGLHVVLGWAQSAGLIH